jgi:hypothetical protein
MDDAPGWLPDPEREDQERYWSGSGWTDRVRPAGKGRPLHLPEHVPDLQRALAAATADIDAVEDRLSSLFERAEGGAPRPSPPPQPVRPPERDADDEELIDLYDEEDDDVAGEDDDPIHEEFTGANDQRSEADDESEVDDADDDDSDDELDAALAAEEPEKSKRGLFRRRS